MEHAAPILPSLDLRETLAFYASLGFENRGADSDEWDYLILGRGDIWLHVALQAEGDPFKTAALGGSKAVASWLMSASR